MATARRLTSDGDLDYQGGRQRVVRGNDAERQALQVAFLTIRGENLFHPATGIHLGAIRSKDPNDKATAIRQAAMHSTRVARVINVVQDERTEAEERARRSRFRATMVMRNGEEVSQGLVI